MTRDWSILPDTALVGILSDVPLQHRMLCALVSTSWAAAAVVATEEMLLTNQKDADSITAHLSSSFSSIRSLEISPGPKQLLSEFPALPNLQDLQLMNSRAQLGPGYSQPGILQSVTGLTLLTLHEVTLTGGLESVSVLTGLRSLSVTDCTQHTFDPLQLHANTDPAGNADADPTAAAAHLPGCLFSQLLQLTYLELRGGLTNSSLQFISCLVQLASLAIDFEGAETSPAAIQGLEGLQGLTFLALTDSGDLDIDAGTVHGISRLTGLDTLWVYNCRSIDPLLLAPLTKLQHLDLDNTPPAGGSKGSAALLAVLPKLQELTHLDLCDCLTDCLAASPAVYSALTASSSLTYLDIQCMQGPKEAWAHLFPAGRTLPQLQRLHLIDALEEPLIWTSLEGLSQQQLQDLVVTCPNLQHLQFALQPRVSPAPLLRLRGLVGLAIQGITGEDVDNALVRMTALQELHILAGSRVDDVGLMPLTALTALTQLGLHHKSMSKEFLEAYSNVATREGEDFVLLDSVSAKNHPSNPPGSAPDVWVKLLRCCVQSPKCKRLLTVPLVQLYCQGAEVLGQVIELRRGAGVLGAIGGSTGDRATVELHLEVTELREQAARCEAVLRNVATATEHVESVVQFDEVFAAACKSRSYAKCWLRYADVRCSHPLRAAIEAEAGLGTGRPA